MQLVKKETQFDNYMVKYIQEFFEAKERKSSNTSENYYSDLNGLAEMEFGYTDVRMMTKKDIESLNIDRLIAYIRKLDNKKTHDGKKYYRNETINRKIMTVRSFLRYLVAREAIVYNLDSFELLEKLNADGEEIEMIPKDIALKYAAHALTNERTGLVKSLMIETALETALRAAELLELEWKQFNVVDDGVIIKSSGKIRAKGNSDYVDKVSHEFYEKLLPLKSTTNSEKVFPLKYRTVANMMTRLNKVFDNENKNYSFHSFRKTAITEVYMHTRCIYTAQQKARHRDINTTKRYLRLTDTAITGIMSRIMTEQEEVYKDVEKDVLLVCIEQLPREMKVLLNRYVHEHLNKNV